jgi:uncharacterized membrane protein YgcG
LTLSNVSRCACARLWAAPQAARFAKLIGNSDKRAQQPELRRIPELPSIPNAIDRGVSIGGHRQHIHKVNALTRLTFELSTDPFEGDSRAQKLNGAGRGCIAAEVFMSNRRILTAIVALIAAGQLAGCTYQPIPAYSYQLVPCTPTASVGAPAASDAASPEKIPATTPPPANALNAPPVPGAAATLPSTAANCVAAVPNDNAAEYPYANYYPYWDVGGPYGDFGFDGFIVGNRFHRGFHFNHEFHGHDFRRGGFHGGGFHGGGGHGGGGGRR